MRYAWVAVAAAAIAASMLGCQKQHPISVFTDPAMADGSTDKIAVLPFASALHESDDPDGIAPLIMEKFFIPELDERGDYHFIAPNTVRYAIEREEWADRYAEFIAAYAKTDEPDAEFLIELADVLKCDAFLVPIVDLWQKDEVDALEDSTPATYVGATITILDKDGQTLLFRAIDEDYEEGARSETAGRSLVTSSSGAIRSDLGAKMHRAPPYEEVVVKVVQALVASIPAR